MNCKPMLSGEALIEIERSRYEELVSAEKELQLIKTAIGNLSDYDDTTHLKMIFGIETKGANNNAV